MLKLLELKHLSSDIFTDTRASRAKNLFFDPTRAPFFIKMPFPWEEPESWDKVRQG